jgi:DNA-binding protein H-NS
MYDNLNAMDVDALLALRGDVETALKERARDLQRQIALLGGSEVKRRGRPPATMGRGSALKGRAVAPKYRGPNGETWAGRGAMPRWLTALMKQGHAVEDYAIAPRSRKAATPSTRKGRKARAS